MKFRLSAWLSCLLLPLAVCADTQPAGASPSGGPAAAAPTAVTAQVEKPAEAGAAAPAEPAKSTSPETAKPASSEPAKSPDAPAQSATPATTVPGPTPASTTLESTAPANPPLASPYPNGPVVIFPFKSQVDDALLMFMRRALKEAERKEASAFVIDMDTPGGAVNVTLEMLEMLHKTKIPTYTFVNPHAISAGAFVSLGTKRIYMRPDATIGAAAIVGGGGEDISKTMKSKADSFMGAKIRAICEENGHNPEIAEAFMLEKEVKIGDKVINPKDRLLSLNGREAARVYDGKRLLAAGLADSVEEVLKVEGLKGEVLKFEPTGFEQVAFWITMISPILLIGGIVGAYIEMKAPGFGIPGIISLICFGLFFGGHLIAGLSGYETVFVFVIGLILIIIEIFVIPGTFVAGLVGTVMVLGSLLWAMVDHWPSSEGLPSGADFERPMLNFVTALVGTGVIVAILAKLLPKTSIYNRLVLAAASAEGPAVSVPLVNLSVRVGDIGTASTTLRPAGKAAFGDEVHDVVTNGGFIAAGSTVKVIETDGMRVVVEAI